MQGAWSEAIDHVGLRKMTRNTRSKDAGTTQWGELAGTRCQHLINASCREISLRIWRLPPRFWRWFSLGAKNADPSLTLHPSRLQRDQKQSPFRHNGIVHSPTEWMPSLPQVWRLNGRAARISMDLLTVCYRRAPSLTFTKSSRTASRHPSFMYTTNYN